MTLLWENRKISIAEYCDLNENDPDHRYEYIDGQVYMRPIEHVRHAVIGANVGYLLGKGLKASPCVAYGSMAWVQLAETRYVYPDLTVSCDPQNCGKKDDAQTVQCPCLVVEISSPHTQAHDRGIKVEIYQACPTMQAFLLVETEIPQVRLYRRESNNRWI
ncbi:MAG: Uma2 family endonuclease, partial [Ktedonobacteraceae bacterium]